MSRQPHEERFEFDDFNFEAFDDFDMGGFESEPIVADRNPVSRIGGSFVRGATEALSDKELQRTIIDKSMPEGFLRTYDAAVGAKDALSDLKYEAKKGLGDLVKTTKRTLAPLTGKIDNILPPDLAKKAKDWISSGNEGSQWDPHAYEREEMRNTMNNIFSSWEATKDQLNADVSSKAMSTDLANDVMNNSINQKLSATGNEELSRIRILGERSRDYNDNVAHKFREKSLELQYKTMWNTAIAADQLKKMTELQQGSFGSIIKNTALPEAVKIRNSELAHQLLKEKSFGAIMGNFSDFAGNIAGRVFNRAKTNINTFFKEAVGGVVSLNTLAQMAGQDNEIEIYDPNETEEQRKDRKRRKELTGAAEGGAKALGGMLGRRGAAKFGEWFKDKYGNSDRVKRTGLALNNAMENMPRYFNDALKGNSGSSIFDIFNDLLGMQDLAYKENKKVRSSSLDDLETQATFNLQTRRTINEVIPGWLARIHNEIRMHRTGTTDLEPMRWSFEGNKFEESSDTLERLKKKFYNDDRIRFSNDDTKKLVDIIDPDGKLNNASREELMKYIVGKGFNENERLSFEDMARESSGLSEGTRNSLLSMLSELRDGDLNLNTTGGVAGDLRNDLTAGMKEQERAAAMNEGIRNLRSMLPQAMSDALKHARAGDMELLQQAGVVKQNAKGDWEINHDEYIKRILDSQGTPQPQGPPPPTPPGPPPPPTAGYFSGGIVRGFSSGGSLSDIDIERQSVRRDLPGDSPLIKRLKHFLRKLSDADIQVALKYLRPDVNGRYGAWSPHQQPFKDFEALDNDFVQFVRSNRDKWYTFYATIKSWSEAGSNTGDVSVPSGPTKVDGLNKVDLSTVNVPAINVHGNGGPTKQSSDDTDIGGVTHANEYVLNAEVVAQPGAKDFLTRFNQIGMRALEGAVNPGSLKDQAKAKLQGWGKGLFNKQFNAPGKASDGAITKFTKGIGGKLRGGYKRIFGNLDAIATEYGGGTALMVSTMGSQSELLETINTTLTTRLPAIAKPINGDADSDGDRDGGWRDILQRRKDGKGDKDEHGLVIPGAPKEEKKGIFGLIAGIGTALATLVGKTISFYKNIFSWGGKIFSWGGKILTAIRALATGKALGGMDGGGRRRGPRGRGRMPRLGGGGKAALLAAAAYGASSYLSSDHTDAIESNVVDSAGMDGIEAKAVDEPKESWTSKALGYAGNALTAYSIGSITGINDKIATGARGLVSRFAPQGARALGGSALRTAGSFIARQGMMAAGRSALMAGGAALVGLVGAPVLIGAAVVGAVAVGGYLLYKRYQSGKAYLSNFRMAQYGFSHKNKDAVSKILELEQLCLQHVNVSKNSPAKLANGLKVEDILAKWDINVKEHKATEKWVAWFTMRFKPVFLGAVTVYYSLTGNTTIQDADDKLTVDQKRKYLDQTHIKDPGSNSPYSVMASPLKDKETVDMNYDAVLEVLATAESKLSKEAKQSGDKTEDDASKAKKETDQKKEKSWWQSTKETMSNWADAAGEGISKAWDATKEFGSKLWDTVTDNPLLLGGPLGLAGAASAAGGYIADKVRELSGSNKEKFKTIVDAASKAGDPHPEVVAAQWALESGWGKKQSGKYNFFGIKATGNEPGTTVKTREVVRGQSVIVNAKFKDYASLEDGIADRVGFVKRNPRYTKAGYYDAKTPFEAASALQRGGYATDPEYARLVSNIIKGAGFDPNSPSKAPNVGGSGGAGSTGSKGGQAFIPYAPSVLAAKNKEALAKNPLGANIHVPSISEMANKQNGAGIYTNPRSVAVQSPMVGDTGTAGVVGPVGAGLVSGNVPKDHRAVKAATHATRKANPSSTGYCAKYVANALQAGGYKFTRQNSAFQYANGPLANAGFTRITDNGKYQIGDVIVWPAHGKSLKGGGIHGHIQIFNGRNWVSDFIQNSIRPGAQYGGVTSSLWRDSTLLNKQITGSVDVKGTAPSNTPAADTKPDGDVKQTPTASTAVNSKASKQTPASVTNPGSSTGSVAVESLGYAGSMGGSDQVSTTTPSSGRTTAPDPGSATTLEKIAKDSLVQLTSINSTLTKLAEVITDKVKTDAKKPAEPESPAMKALQSIQQQLSNQSTGINPQAGTSKGLDSLFNKSPSRARTSPVDLKS